MQQQPFDLPKGVQLSSKQMAPFVSERSNPDSPANKRPLPFGDDSTAPDPEPVATSVKMPTSFDTPENRSEAIRQLMPAIRSSAKKYARSDDPVIIGQAKILVSRALPRYEPGKGSLNTFVDRQLQPLMRYASRRSRRVRLPDRMQLDAMLIRTAEKEYEDEEGRPPTMTELRRRTGLTPKRIEAVRRADKSVISGDMQFGDEGDSMVTASDLPVLDDEGSSLSWVRFIRDDLPEVDQLILDYSLGLNGLPQLKTGQIAKKLKISSAAVSQRAKRIQMLLNREDELNPFK